MSLAWRAPAPRRWSAPGTRIRTDTAGWSMCATYAVAVRPGTRRRPGVERCRVKYPICRWRTVPFDQTKSRADCKNGPTYASPLGLHAHLLEPRRTRPGHSAIAGGLHAADVDRRTCLQTARLVLGRLLALQMAA